MPDEGTNDQLRTALERLAAAPEPAPLPSLPTLPSPGEFPVEPSGGGRQLARIITLALAGATNPQVGVAYAAEFARQDAIAKEEARGRYQDELARIQQIRSDILAEARAGEAREAAALARTGVRVEAEKGLRALRQAPELEAREKREAEDLERLRGLQIHNEELEAAERARKGVEASLASELLAPEARLQLEGALAVLESAEQSFRRERELRVAAVEKPGPVTPEEIQAFAALPEAKGLTGAEIQSAIAAAKQREFEESLAGALRVPATTEALIDELAAGVPEGPARERFAHFSRALFAYSPTLSDPGDPARAAAAAEEILRVDPEALNRLIAGMPGSPALVADFLTNEAGPWDLLIRAYSAPGRPAAAAFKLIGRKLGKRVPNP